MTDSSIQVPSPDSLYARLPLEEQDAIAPREAGQKAARLSDVMRLGLPTPGGG